MGALRSFTEPSLHPRRALLRGAHGKGAGARTWARNSLEDTMMRQSEDRAQGRLLDMGALGCTEEQWNSLRDLKKNLHGEMWGPRNL